MPSNRKAWNFGQVDHSLDPQTYIHYLDTITSQRQIQAIKQQSYQLLEIHKEQYLLDIGCGTGNDVRALAQLVGDQGKVIGIDSSSTMITEARRRSEGFPFPVEFHQGDCANLPFADATFGGCRAERVFQHLTDPDRTLIEMIRVARPGASIVIIDTDYGMNVINLHNSDLARRVANFVCDWCQNGWIGRQLSGMMKQHGLQDIRIIPTVRYFTTFEEEEKETTQRELSLAYTQGILSAEETQTFIEELEHLDREGQFFQAGVLFTFVGRKPYSST